MPTTRRATQSFAAVVESGHKGCALVLPFDPRKVWGRRARQFVGGTLNGRRFEGEIGLRWGRHFLFLGDDVLDALQSAAGDELSVVLRRREANELDAPIALRLPPTRLLSVRTRPRSTSRDERRRTRSG
jgi:hypothetical protein